MIEITLTDMFLLGWAIIATVGWMKARADEHQARTFIKAFLAHKELRDQIVKAHDHYVSQHES